MRSLLLFLTDLAVIAAVAVAVVTALASTDALTPLLASAPPSITNAIHQLVPRTPELIGVGLGLFVARLVLRGLLLSAPARSQESAVTTGAHIERIIRGSPDALPTAEEVLLEEARNPKLDIRTLADDILLVAERLGASDIHLEPKEASYRLSLRIDGIMHDVVLFPKRIQLPLVNRLKIISHLDITKTDVPQDGRIEEKIRGRSVNVRVSVFPTHYGAKIVIRLLEAGMSTLPPLDEIGLHPYVLERFRALLRMPQGLVIITGPAGSGKSTLLYGSLREIVSNADSRRNVVTLEDPIERVLDDVNQTQVDNKRGLSFAVGLRTLLRQDPDVMMVGEIRDLETAKIALQAGQTGHLLLTTLHTNSAAGAFSRLIDMGIEPFLLTAAVSGVASIRLVRRICVACRVPRVPSPAAVEQLRIKLAPGQVYYEGAGCEACQHTGFNGRMAVFELLTMSPEISELVVRKATVQEIVRAAQAKGMLTLFQDALAHVGRGDTSLAEMQRMIVGDQV